MHFPLSHRLKFIEIRTARYILYTMGLHARRGADYLRVYAAPDDLVFYIAPTQDTRDDVKLLGSLYVDEGCQSNVLYVFDALDGFGVRDTNRAFDEVIDATDLLGIIVRHFFPDEVIVVSQYIGRGFAARHYHSQYVEILNNKTIGPFTFSAM